MKAIEFKSTSDIANRFRKNIGDKFESSICVDGIHVRLGYKFDAEMSVVGVEFDIIGFCDKSCELDLGKEYEENLAKKIAEFRAGH